MLIASQAGNQGALIYRRGQSWNLESALSLPPTATDLRCVATNGERAFLGCDDGTYVYKFDGTQWPLVATIPSPTYALALYAEFVATNSQVYRFDSLFQTYLSEGFIDIGGNSRNSIAFDENGDLFGRRVTFGPFGGLDSRFERWSRSPAGAWSMAERLSMSAVEYNTQYHIEAEDGWVYVRSSNFISGQNNRVQGLHLASSSMLTFGESSVPYGPAVTGSRLAYARSGQVFVRNRDCNTLGSLSCLQTVPHSGATTGTLVALGSELVADSDFLLRASRLPTNQFVMFIASQVSGSTPGAGGSQGTLCLTGNIGRYNGVGQIMSAGSSGSVSLTPNLDSMPTGVGAVLPGDTWYFQAWFRDSNPQGTSNFSDALEVTFN